MSQFQPMKTSTLIISQVLVENLLDEVYEVFINIILKLHSNLCRRYINLYDGVWVIILVQLDVLSQTFPFC